MKSLKVELPPELVPPKRSKYRNVPTLYNGVRYQSKAEAERAEYLDRMVALSAIDFWVPQPKFRLGVPENLYVGDFLVIAAGVSLLFKMENRAECWVEEVKGRETAKFKRDRRLWKSYGPCDLRIIRKGGVVDIIPGGKGKA